MPRDVLSHIFEPFFTTRLRQGGSGLGMSICYNLATGPLGGRVDVASTLGEGCMVTPLLPRVVQA
jgi:signal transduction histidine kinase